MSFMKTIFGIAPKRRRSLPPRHYTRTVAGIGLDDVLEQDSDQTIIMPDNYLGKPGSMQESQQQIALAQPGDFIEHYAGQVVKAKRGGEFHLTDMLGVGGFGEVWEAEEVCAGGSTRTVALKFLTFASQNVAEKFLDEAALTANLRHPNILSSQGAFETRGLFNREYFIRMECVKDGRDLSDLMVQLGQLSPQGHLTPEMLLTRNALQIPYQIHELNLMWLARALDYAHTHGESTLIHRDIKPANMMLDDTGLMRLLDFGVAVTTDDEDGIKIISGTPPYLAPETFDLRKPIDEKVDLWSAGITFYELFSGGILPTDANLESNRETKVTSGRQACVHLVSLFGDIQDGTKRIVPLHRLIEGFPKPLSDIIDGLLTVDKDERIQSARDLDQYVSEDLYPPGSGKGATQQSQDLWLRIYDRCQELRKSDIPIERQMKLISEEYPNSMIEKDLGFLIERGYTSRMPGDCAEEERNQRIIYTPSMKPLVLTEETMIRLQNGEHPAIETISK